MPCETKHHPQSVCQSDNTCSLPFVNEPKSGPTTPPVLGTLEFNKPCNSSLAMDVRAYIDAWPKCAQVCTPCQLPTGLLELPPMPWHPWAHITVDSVTNLSSSHGFTIILVALYQFLKACNQGPPQSHGNHHSLIQTHLLMLWHPCGHSLWQRGAFHITCMEILLCKAHLNQPPSI